METCTSEEELVVKMRKPYTITKQRERWTDEEHKRFLEALKTYGRAWQRIEEHIGTKTAVQIRSHAQKFFSKLEKEAQAKGVPLGHAYDIDIPPPRPKRKPNNPYPRKTFNGAICSSGESTSSSPNKDVLCLNKDAAAPEKLGGTETMERMKVASQNGNLEMVNVFQEDTHLTVKACGDPSYSRDLIAMNTYPIVEEDNKKKQSAPNFDELGKCSLEGLCLQSDKRPPAEGSLDKSMTVDKSAMVSDNLHRVHQGHQKLETVHLQDGNIESTHCNSNTGRSLCHQPVAQALPNLFKNSAVSGISEQHTKSTISFPHQLPCFPPVALLQNSQVSFGSNISSTFTNLIVSALLQNPAAHAAASLMASYWPSLDTDISLNSTAESFKDGTSPRPVNPASSAVAIAAATVAAATAWWATHGLFPMCHPPCPTGMTFPSTAAIANHVNETNTAGGINEEQTKATTTVRSSEDLQDPATEPKKFSAFSSLKSEDSSRGGMTCAAELKNCNRSPKADDLLCATDTGILDYNKARNKKKQDRSSCGSNTTSSSEETEEKVVLAEDLKKAQTAHLPVGETSNRRTRSSLGVNESWKEVSQEGRQAFQALFSREVLPQSFSPPQAGESVAENDKKEKSSNTSLVDLNKKAWTDSGKDQVLNATPMRDAFYFNKSSLANRRAGFKPYKRCSEEAQESRTADSDNKNNSKRLRLEGESSV